jgi:hypothetical protein
MAKADATAFFTLVNRGRCLSEIAAGIDFFEKKGGRGVILHKEIKSIGKILQGKRHCPRTHRLISFEDMRKALRFLEHDRFFTTGQVVWERLDGLAMGSAPSPPIAAFDLDYHSRMVYTSKARAKEVGVYVAGLKTTKVLQAMLHVDDCIFCSKVWCCRCIERIATSIWPSDVSAKIEESGHSIDFLHIRIQATPNSKNTNLLEYSPILHNLSFCQGVHTMPKVAKFPQYLSHDLHPLSHLQPIIWGKAAVITSSCRTTTADFFLAVCCLAAEGMLLGWPPRHIGAAMASFPKAYRGPPANFIRLLGQTLRKSRAADKVFLKAKTGMGDSMCMFPWFAFLVALCDWARRSFDANPRHLAVAGATASAP